MGKKKDKHGKHGGGKHGGGRDAPGHDAAGTHGPIPAPLAGLAAMVAVQLKSPATRAMMATGLRAAADALSRMPAPPPPPAPPRAPVPPQPAAGPMPPVPPVSPVAEQVGPQGTTKAPDMQAIGDAIGQAAEQVLGRFFGGRKV